MQGQEADIVLISYGLSSFREAMKQAKFIYSLNRMNVSISRAKKKCVLFLSNPLYNVPNEMKFDSNLGEHFQYFIDLADLLSKKGSSSETVILEQNCMIYRLASL